MLFLEWLLDQRNDEGVHSRLARLIWRDIETGCLQPVKSVIELGDHYREHHGHIAYRVNTLISEAFGAYTDRFSK